MKNNNQSIVTGFFVAVSIFGSTAAQAAQTCQEMQGELQMISVEGYKIVPNSMEADLNAEISKIEQENLIRLDEKAQVLCPNNKFCIDEASIESKFDIIEFFTTRIDVQTTAIMNCLE